MIVCIFYFCVLLEDFFCVVCMGDDSYFDVVETLKAFSSTAFTDVMTADSNSVLQMILVLN